MAASYRTLNLLILSPSSSDSDELSLPMTIPRPSCRTGRPLILDTRARSFGAKSSSTSLPSSTLFSKEGLREDDRLGDGERALL